MTSLSPILGKWTKLENNGNTCRTDTKIGIGSILKVRNPKMKSLFENFTTCCDIIISNFREMGQIREQRNYLPDKTPKLVFDVTAGGEILKISKR